jgi:diguanylate cyclase (GGDEF)-like protein
MVPRAAPNMVAAVETESVVAWTRNLRRMLSLNNAPVAISALLIIVCGIFIDRQNRQLYEERSRAAVLSELSVVQAKLEGDINGNVQLVRGLASTIATEPNVTQERFSQLAESLLNSRSQIRDIAGAPGLVVSLLYPLRGNEKALGLDYRTSAAQRDTVLRARESGDVVLAGPVNLVQGGKGFIARFPVFARDPDGDRSFWGIVSAVIDSDKLYRDAGLDKPDLPIEVAITGVDALGKLGDQFFGDPSVVYDRPVTMEIKVPSGSWHIAARPKGGWSASPPNRWFLRLGVVAFGILFMLPTWLYGRLVEERRGYSLSLRERESKLELLSRRLELALDASKVGVWDFNIDTQELFWDDRMNELYNYPCDGGPRSYKHWRDRLDDADAERAAADFDRAIRTQGRYESQFRLNLGDGRTRVIRTIGKVYAAPGAATQIVGVNWDVTSDVALTEDLTRSKALTEARNAELEAARASIEHNSLHDFLTGLPNRMYLERALEEHAARCAATGGGVVLLHIDLDGFKQINDTLGHSAGDAMLIHTAQTIRRDLGESDFVARTGGDEFVILCEADSELEGFAALARRLIDSLRTPPSYEGHECRFGMSIGIAGAFGQTVDWRRLLVNADLALYRAKSRGRNRFEFFSEALQADILSAKQMADSIVAGLERGEFVPFYQPQFDARTFQIVGVEALVRWRHPTRGVVPPAEFIAAAEELTVIGAIDRSVLEQALAQFQRWRSRGFDVPRLSVNVSLRRMHDESLLRELREAKIERGALAFELVESIYLDESDDRFSSVIDQLKELGIELEIDDFGTGYASIVSLTKIKPSRLKIDRQLVTPIVVSEPQRRLVQSIVDIGRSLDIEIVAEGVETMEHAQMLREIGCDILQGYAFAKPMPAEELERFIAAPVKRLAS